MEALYRENYGLLCYWANRYRRLLAGTTVEADDLIQEGFLGLVEAATTFDASRGAWSTWASYHLRRRMLDALRLRRRAPVTISLDEPICDDVLLGDTLEDRSLPDVDAGVLRNEIVRAVREAVEGLEDEDVRRAIRLAALEGKTHAQAAQALGVDRARAGQLIRKGRAQLERNWRLRMLADVEERTRFHAHKGVEAFRSSGSSVVEDAVLWRESLRERQSGFDEHR